MKKLAGLGLLFIGLIGLWWLTRQPLACQSLIRRSALVSQGQVQVTVQELDETGQPLGANLKEGLVAGGGSTDLASCWRLPTVGTSVWYGWGLMAGSILLILVGLVMSLHHRRREVAGGKGG